MPKTNETTQRLLAEAIREQPAATIKKRRLFLEKSARQSLSISTVRRLLKRMGYSQKPDPLSFKL